MENVKSFLSKKSQSELVEKIKNKDKNFTRASLFQFSEDGKQEFFLCGLIVCSAEESVQNEGKMKFKNCLTILFFRICKKYKKDLTN